MTTTLFALELGASEFTIGVLMSLFALLPMLLSVSAGRLIDRAGPRRPLLLSFAALAFAAALPFAFPRLETLYLSSTLLGVAFMYVHIAMNSVFGAARLARAARDELQLAGARLLDLQLDRPAGRRLRHRRPRPRARLRGAGRVPARRAGPAVAAQAPAAAAGARAAAEARPACSTCCASRGLRRPSWSACCSPPAGTSTPS